MGLAIGRPPYYSAERTFYHQCRLSSLHRWQSCAGCAWSASSSGSASAVTNSFAALCSWVLRNDPGITSPILLVPEFQAEDFEFIPTIGTSIQNITTALDKCPFRPKNAHPAEPEILTDAPEALRPILRPLPRPSGPHDILSIRKDPGWLAKVTDIGLTIAEVRHRCCTQISHAARQDGAAVPLQA
jgi:hypothetical protein